MWKSLCTLYSLLRTTVTVHLSNNDYFYSIVFYSMIQIKTKTSSTHVGVWHGVLSLNCIGLEEKKSNKTFEFFSSSQSTHIHSKPLGTADIQVLYTFIICAANILQLS